ADDAEQFGAWLGEDGVERADPQGRYGIESTMPALHDHRDAAAHRLTDADNERVGHARLVLLQGAFLEPPHDLAHEHVIAIRDPLNRDLVHQIDATLPDAKVVNGNENGPPGDMVLGLRVPFMAWKAHIVIVLRVSAAR